MKIHRINKKLFHLCFAAFLLTFFLVACGNKNSPIVSPEPAAGFGGDIQVTIMGGHDADPRDGGRPVVLIASALGVPPEVFREVFSHVQPAPAGQEPDPEQVKLNKEALLNALGPYGVTNDLLDTVSNYYRFNGSAGETWPQTPAKVTAIIRDGVVSGFTITDPGSGYTTPPTIAVSGSDITATAVISFSTDFKTNGSLTEIKIVTK